jgi:predicted GIY-YIG superfamily endonuclease
VRCADRTLYTGVAKDLPARIAAHNDGRGAKYTRPRLPVKLVYSEAAPDRAVAQRREYAIKRLSPVAKRALCSQLMTEKRRPSGRMIAFKK